MWEIEQNIRDALENHEENKNKDLSSTICEFVSLECTPQVRYSLWQALRQCRRAKNAGEQWNSKRAKNGGKIIHVLYTSMPNIDAHNLRQ